MPRIKQVNTPKKVIVKEEFVVKEEVKVVNKNATLKAFLLAKMPAMFDRTPEITGNMDAFVEEIIKIIK